ncbi:MAG: hypothetical protein HKO71_00780 [Pseudomonadales bacterium]|nr:hypothetical protein [Gammaproteobacteria bacterium]NNL56260.1 hypothetical protein [Pseudomonadales bacterium]
MPKPSQRICQIAPEFNHLSNSLATLEAQFSAGGETLYAVRNLIKRLALGEHDVVVKSFRPPAGLQAFVYAQFRASKARRSYEHALKLQQLGIATPRPVCYIEHRQPRALLQSYYVALYYPHDYSMQAVLKGINSAGNPANSDQNLAALQDFVRFTYRLHEAGVLHQDHNAGNTLLRKTAAGHDFAIIDINRMQFKTLSLDQRLKNFVRLSDNPTVLQCIAATYAQCIGMDETTCLQRLMLHKRRHWRRITLKQSAKRLLQRKG